MTKDQFYVGQRVKEKDPDEGYMVYGKVMEVKESSVVIQWDDPEWGMMEIDHPLDELPNIKDGNPSH